MKKRILIVFSICIALFLVGCKGDSKSSDVNTSNKPVSAQPSKIPSTQPSAEPSKKPAEQLTKEPTKEPIIVTPSADTKVTTQPGDISVNGEINYRIESNYDNDRDYNKNIDYTKCEYETIKIESKEYNALKNAIEKWNSKKDGEPVALAKQARSNYVGNEDFWGGPYIIDSKCFIKRSDSRIFSYEDSYETFEGGAHGNVIYTGYNFDSKTGKEIHMSDVIADEQGLAEALKEKLIDQYGADTFMDKDLSKVIKENFIKAQPGEQSKMQFTLGYNSITFYFSPYDLAPYAAGMQEVTLLYKDYKKVLKPDYFSYEPKAFVYAIYDGAENRIDVNEDGKAEKVTVSGKNSSDEGVYTGITVAVNGKKATQQTHTYQLKPYFVKVNSKSYVYVQLIGENDSGSYMVFDITNKKPVYVGEKDGHLYSFTNPDHFHIDERLDILSTYSGTRLFHVGKNGMPVCDSKEYEVNASLTLTSTVELKGDVVNPANGKVTGTSSFPAGTAFDIVGTDNATYVKLKTSKGIVAKFKITTEWPQTINGKDAEKCFETLFWAG